MTAPAEDNSNTVMTSSSVKFSSTNSEMNEMSMKSCKSRASTQKKKPKTQWKQWKKWKMKTRGNCPPVLRGWPPDRVCGICWPNWLVRKPKTPKDLLLI